MTVVVETRDCASLTDTDLDELASMGGSFDIGAVSKAKEDWVLFTSARATPRLIAPAWPFGPPPSTFAQMS